MNKYPLSIDEILYIFEKLIVGASCAYAIHVLQFLLREIMLTNMELTMDALRTLLHQQFKQGQKGSAATRKLVIDVCGRRFGSRIGQPNKKMAEQVGANCELHIFVQVAALVGEWEYGDNVENGGDI